jgi:hypothetical protein
MWRLRPRHCSPPPAEAGFPERKGPGVTLVRIMARERMTILSFTRRDVASANVPPSRSGA